MQAESPQKWWQGITRYQWFVLFVAWLGWVFDIMDTAIFNFVKTPMLQELLPPGAETAVVEGNIQMIFIIGWALGGFLFGILADRWGRAKTMALTILLYCIFTGLHAACQSWQQVAAVRFLTGLGIGGEWAAGAALVAETFADKWRPLAAAFLQTAAAAGPVLAALANLALADQSWRWIFLVGIAPAFITVLIRRGIKEPERWQQYGSTSRSTLGTLFGQRKWATRAVLAMIIGTVGIAGAGTIAFWFPNLIDSASKGLDPVVIQERKSYGTMILHIGTLLGVFVFPWLAARIGRKAALAVGFVCAPLSLLFVLYGGADYQRLLVFGPLLTFFTIGLTAIYGLYFPELFPTSVRATGSGFAYNTARILQAPVYALTGMLIADYKGSAEQGVLVASSIYVIGFLAVLLAPETRGKPLPEDE